MTPRHLIHITFLAVSKRFDSVCADLHSGLFRHGHGGNSRIPGSSQLPPTEQPLGHGTFYEYDSHGREPHTWGLATYSVDRGYDAYSQRNLLRTFRNTNADFNSAISPLNATGDAATWIYDEATGTDPKGRKKSRL